MSIIFDKCYPIEELNPSLFYIVNDFCKKTAKPQEKRRTQYLCPGCLFLGKKNEAILTHGTLKCPICQSELTSTNDPKRLAFFATFSHHNKKGFRCQDCSRFIPYPMDDTSTIVCAYFDCCFVGDLRSLVRMHHPSRQVKVKLPDIVPEDEITQSIEPVSQVKKLSNVIKSLKNGIPYNNYDSTAKQKMLTYQAFANVLERYPDKMLDYLLNESRSGGFQHKVFQEYVKLLEEAMPFQFKKNKTFHKVQSLLDDSLNLFDGVSVFDAIVSEKMIVKNGTHEFYIGGRKSAISRPYYIGKLLDVMDKKTKTSVIDRVKEYSFSVIKMSDIQPGTEVTVTHLRVPPHYQMGGMVYVNRIRKKIIEQVKAIL